MNKRLAWTMIVLCGLIAGALIFPSARNHDGYLILGRIAAAEGNLEEAKRYLLEAGKITGSPVLGSFGPNMSLAKDLLQVGERDTVLEYFKQCKTFWSKPELAAWSEDVREGRIPNFGSNLYY